MAIPLLQREEGWTGLSAEEKRARLLLAAGEVFARDGLDAPMPAIAAAAGAGMGSVYRQFPSKRELLAALVVERLEEVEEDVRAALESPADHWTALTAWLRAYAKRQATDDVLAEAMSCVATDPSVEQALASTTSSLERLLDAAKREGCLRSDATTLDLRLIFAATRAAGQLDRGAWRRMVELGIDGLAQ